jgi:glycosyltransferase involved in cell wall biosynthesis
MTSGNQVPAWQSVWVVIPAYNEREVIRSVVEPLIEEDYNVVIVDDASTDGTHLAACEFPVHVCRHAVNLGQGAALQTGIEYALRHGAKFIVTYDADGQHVPENIPMLLAPLLNHDYCVALGTRFGESGRAVGMPLVRRLLLKAAALYTRLATGLAVTDAHNGCRALSADAARKIAITQNRMAHATQLLEQISKHRLKYVEVPVVVRYTTYSLAKGQKTSDILNVLWESIVGRLKR